MSPLSLYFVVCYFYYQCSIILPFHFNLTLFTSFYYTCLNHLQVSQMNDLGAIFSQPMLMVYMQVNMGIISKVAMFFLLIMIFLFSTTHSVVLEPTENHIKLATYFSKEFEVGPGTVVVKALLNIDFPRCHIGSRVLMLK